MRAPLPVVAGLLGLEAWRCPLPPGLLEHGALDDLGALLPEDSRHARLMLTLHTEFQDQALDPSVRKKAFVYAGENLPVVSLDRKPCLNRAVCFARLYLLAQLQRTPVPAGHARLVMTALEAALNASCA